VLICRFVPLSRRTKKLYRNQGDGVEEEEGDKFYDKSFKKLKLIRGVP
jgi:hypothetical protein